MSLFGKKKEKDRNRVEKIPFDPEKQIPVLRCSICNGEQVLGFKDRDTGHFTEVSLIRGEQELDRFRQLYGFCQITKEY